jgi:thioredoxin reductase/bacterioferritin-associated ferredoxin
MSYDVVIIGSGPAGMATAIDCDKFGLSTIVLDEQPMLGGQIYRNIEYANSERMKILGSDYEYGNTLAHKLRKSRIEYKSSVTVWNVTRHGEVNFVTNRGVQSEGRSQSIKGKFVVIATGAMERPFPIKGWTLPGVMGAGAAQILLKSSSLIPHSSSVLIGEGPLLYLLAYQYIKAGYKPTALVSTTRTWDYFKALPNVPKAMLSWKDFLKGLKLILSMYLHGIKIYSGVRNIELNGTDNLEEVSFKHKGSYKKISAGLALLHQGVVPNTQITMSENIEHRWNENQICWEPVTDEWGRVPETNLYIAGDGRGIVGAQASETQGRLAALSIADQLKDIDDFLVKSQQLKRTLSKQKRIRPLIDKIYRPKEEFRIPQNDDVTVCRCEEVSAGQIREYVDLGCMGPNQTKAFGRCGMGLCQGRFCSLTVTEIIAKKRKVRPQEVGHYRIRAPIKPILLGDLANTNESTE